MNAKLEEILRQIEVSQYVSVAPSALRFIRDQLSTIEPDLAIAQAAREWLKWHNNADECNKAEHKLRAAVEKGSK